MYQSKGQPTLLSCRSLVPQPSRRPAEPTHAHERTSECTQKGYSRRRVQYQRLSFRARAGEGSIPPSSFEQQTQTTPHCRLTNALPSDGSSPKLTARLQKALPCGRFNAAIEQRKAEANSFFVSISKNACSIPSSRRLGGGSSSIARLIGPRNATRPVLASAPSQHGLSSCMRGAAPRFVRWSPPFCQLET